MLEHAVQNSVYERIGLSGLIDLSWRAPPTLAQPIAFLYNLFVYRDLLRRSRNLTELEEHHLDAYTRSLPFRVLRPRFRDHVKPILREEYHID